MFTGLVTFHCLSDCAIGPTHNQATSLLCSNHGAHSYYGNAAELCGGMSRGLKVVQWNLRSICPTGNNTKLDELRLILRDPWKQCHVLGDTESWLNETYDNKDVAIDGYHPPQRCDRVGKSGGGVAVYVIDGFDFMRRTDIETPDIESVWIEMKPRNSKPILICTVYRPPDSNLDQWLEGLEVQINSAYTGSAHIVVMGDINVNYLSDSAEKDKLCACMRQYEMRQIVKDATRCTTHKQSLIDHVWISSTNYTPEIKVPVIGTSDHSPTCLVMSSKGFNVNQHTSIRYRSFKNFDENKFKSDTGEVPWGVLEMFDDPNDFLGVWNDLFLNVLDSHAPMREKRVKRQWQPGWLTDDIVESMRTREYHKAKKNDELYKHWRNKVVSQIRQSKIEYYESLVRANAGNTHKIWSYMKELAPRATSVLPSRLQDGGDSKFDVANDFNNFFTEIVTKYIPTDNNNFDTTCVEECATRGGSDAADTFEIPHITISQTVEILSSLDINKATGVDGIPSRVLKLASAQIAPSICKLINLCLDQGVFPSQWKQAKVSPIHKGGQIDDPGNFRPVSILCTLSKIFERHIHNCLYEHLQPYLYHGQSGFRQNHSCETALSRMVDLWTKNIDAGNINGVILLDLRKAFDLINHRILLTKLQKYKVGEMSIKLLDSYLSDRTQFVAFKGANSDPLYVRSGVPQGSIVGPLLFLAYMNDLPVCLSDGSSLDMFADDSTLTAAAKSVPQIEASLNCDLEAVNMWCLNNKMAINSVKTKAMLLTTSQRRSNMQTNINVSLSGDKLEVVDKAKLLGVIVDHNLTWKSQIDNVCLKMTKHIALLRRIKPFLSQEMRKTYYMAYIQSSTDYCLTIWGHCSDIHRVRKLQNLALRIIADEPRRTSSLPLFRRYRVMPITDRLTYRINSLVFKSMNGMAPDYLSDMFTLVSASHGRRTRASTNGDLAVPRHKLNLRKNTLAIRGPQLFNDCDNSIKMSGSMQTFKYAYYKNYFSHL